MKTLKILGIFLLYPDEEWISECPHMMDILSKEMWLDKKNVALLREFCHQLQKQDILSLQETYVGLFDRTPSLSLHLFEHVHGDSRDRGQALVDLQNIYAEHNLEIEARETPDHLPLFLEYLSILTLEEAVDHLKVVATIFSILGSRLENRKSIYASLFKALEALAEQKPNKKLISKALAEDKGAALNQFELDHAWEEQLAFSQPSENPCNNRCKLDLRKDTLR